MCKKVFDSWFGALSAMRMTVDMEMTASRANTQLPEGPLLEPIVVSICGAETEKNVETEM